MSVMNSRRLMRIPRLESQHRVGSNECFEWFANNPATKNETTDREDRSLFEKFDFRFAKPNRSPRD
jgi:hypothetical protein